MRRPPLHRVALLLVLGAAAIGYAYSHAHHRSGFVGRWLADYPALARAGVAGAPVPAGDPFVARLVAAARERTTHRVLYDAAYERIPYPGGDVRPDRGVCSDEIIRAYRALGIDLQKRVHEDMAAHFDAYPKVWGLPAPDANIDHRRVPNLMVFFARHGDTLPITRDAEDYRPGDLVCWDLGNGVTHIGIAVDERGVDGKRPMIVHNIGAGPKLEDVLFDWEIIGHFRYRGDGRTDTPQQP